MSKLRSIKLFRIMGVLMMLAIMTCLTVPAAFADPGSVAIYSVDSSGNKTLMKTDTYSDFTSMNNQETNVYSTWCCQENKYRYWTAQGPTLQQVLQNAGINTSAINYVTFVDSSGSAAVTWSDLTTGLYYPSIDQSNPVAVDPIIATQSLEGEGVTLTSSDNTEDMRDFYGQQLIGDTAMKQWKANLTEIDVNLN